MNDTPTPETDENTLRAIDIDGGGEFDAVHAQVSKRLERERNELVTALTKIAYDPTQSAEVAGRALNKLIHQLEQ
jgi:hypothetical protein